MPPLTSGHLKKVVSGIKKNHVKYFFGDLHQNRGYKRPACNIKSSLINLYNSFSPQSFG